MIRVASGGSVSAEATSVDVAVPSHDGFVLLGRPVEVRAQDPVPLVGGQPWSEGGEPGAVLAELERPVVAAPEEVIGWARLARGLGLNDGQARERDGRPVHRLHLEVGVDGDPAHRTGLEQGGPLVAGGQCWLELVAKRGDRLEPPDELLRLTGQAGALLDVMRQPVLLGQTVRSRVLTSSEQMPVSR